MGAPVWNVFDTRQELADALAASVAGSLARAIETRGVGLLAVSGGRTPALFFEALAAQDIEWRRVVVTLVDERFVPDTSERSNQRFVLERLLVNRAKAARFIGLFTQAENVEAAAALGSEAVSLWPTALDVAVLGMGTDGHTASFFPDAEQLDQLLENSEGHGVLAVHAPSAEEARLTMSVQTIAQAGRVILHIEGAQKRQVLEQASAAPIHRLIDSLPLPLEIYWTADG